MVESARYLANCSILFTELPLLERPHAARAAGFDAVEFWWPFTESVPGASAVREFVTAITRAGVQLAGLNFAAGDMSAGDRGLVSWPGREAEFRASVEVAVDIGRRLGVRTFNALYGNRVGQGPLFPAPEQDALAVRNLIFAAQAAASIDAVVLLEPLSGAPRYPLRTAADVFAVIDSVTSAAPVTNLRLLADLYHLAVNGEDVDAVIAGHSPRIGHVQIADSPGRHEPGTGELPLRQQVAALMRAGYGGWIGLEYVPSTTTEASFGWLPAGERDTRQRIARSEDE
jgi:hydroxypyruvate isomerase